MSNEITDTEADFSFLLIDEEKLDAELARIKADGWVQVPNTAVPNENKFRYASLGPLLFCKPLKKP